MSDQARKTKRASKPNRLVENIAKWLRVFVEPSGVTELRAFRDTPNGYQTVAGYFDYAHLMDMAKEAERLSGNHRGVYFVPNPVNPKLLARSPNKVGKAVGEGTKPKGNETHTTKDEDVVRLRWLLIDIDPVKADGHKKDSSTEEEKDAAWKVLCNVEDGLTAVGLTNAVVASSGNGFHLCYPIDLPNSPAIHEQIRDLIHTLHERYSTDGAEVDKKTHNAARIWKLYGTTARKGKETKDRPHRMAFIDKVPEITDQVREANSLGVSRALKAWRHAEEKLERHPEQAGERGDRLMRAKLYCEKVERIAISGQNGHNDAWHVVCRVVQQFDLNEAEGYEALQGWNARCLPPWSEKELRHKIRDAIRRCNDADRGRLLKTMTGGESRSPAQKPEEQVVPYRPFPTHTLPTPLGRFVKEGATAIGCDPAYLALPALAAAAAAAGTTRAVELKPDWAEYPILWAMVVADSGSKKTPAFNAALKPLEELNSELIRGYDAERAQHESALHEWELADNQDRGPRPRPPVGRRVLVRDATIEALVPLLRDNPRGLLAARDELSGLVQSFGQYKNGRGGDRAAWLEFHSGGAVTVDRKGGEQKTLHVARAAVSIAGGIQPGVLRKVFDQEVVDSGFEARFLVAMPPRVVSRWSEERIDGEVAAGYEAAIRGLYALQPDEAGEPARLVLDAAAKRRWVAFYDEWQDRLAAAVGREASTLSKLEAAAARLALVHHLVTEVAAGRDGTAAVGEESVQAAVELVHWLAAEAERIRVTLATAAPDTALDLVRRLAERHGGRLTVKLLQQANTRRYTSAEIARAELDRLVGMGHGCWVEQPPPGRGGHPVAWFVPTPHHSSYPRPASPADRGQE